MPDRWRTVRVFVSSTFRDMQAERDHLVKVVFPELRERLQPHRIHLVDVDLRWGVTAEQAENDRALNLCLDLIDECRPFFIGILGARYGWVPRRFPQEAVSKCGWIQDQTGKSITALEISHGVLRSPAMRMQSFFYFRDPSFTEQVPRAMRRDLEAESRKSARRLTALKAEIRSAGLPVRDYRCGYAGLRINRRLAFRGLSRGDWRALDAAAPAGVLDPDQYASLRRRVRRNAECYGTARLSGLESFGAAVRDDLWAAICRQYPEILEEDPPSPPQTAQVRSPTAWLAEEQDYHEHFIESRTRVYVGRAAAHREVLAHLEGDATVPLLVSGASGSGKSAFLAALSADLARRDDLALVVPHFVGASPRSTDLRLMLRRFCLTVRERFDLTEMEVPDEAERLPAAFRDFLSAVPAGAKVVFVVDALDQLDETDRAPDLSWLPREWPPTVKMVVSCAEGQGGGSHVLLGILREWSCPECRVTPLTRDEQEEIVTRVPSLSAKSLDAEQIDLLLSNPATRNPLFLSVALEELRGFGSFEQLNDRIRAFPSPEQPMTPGEYSAMIWSGIHEKLSYSFMTIPLQSLSEPGMALFEQVLDRLEEEFNAEVVGKTLSLVALSRHGLSERELRDLIEPVDGDGNLFAILRQLRPYLLKRGELVGFYHQSLQWAVCRRYLVLRESEQAGHTALARYFQSKGHAYTRTLTELPHHLEKVKWSELAEILTNYDFVEAKADAGMTFDLALDYRLAMQTIGALDEDLAGRLRAWQRFISTSTHNLVRGDEPFLQLAHNHADSGVVAEAAESRRAAFDRPWLRLLKRPPLGAEPACLRVLEGHAGPVNAVAVTADGRWAASGSKDKTVRVWDLETGKCLRVLEGHADSVNALAATPDARKAVSGSADATVRVWDLETGECLRVLEGHTNNVHAVTVTPSGWLAVSAGDDATRVWDLETGACMRLLAGHSEPALAVVVTPDGREAVSGSWRGPLLLWNLMSGELQGIFGGDEAPARALAMASDGNRAVTASDSHCLRVWHLDRQRCMLALRGHTGEVSAVALTPDDQRVVSGSSDRTVRIWDLNTGNCLGVLEGHAGGVRAVTITPDGGRVVSGSDDGTLRIWDLERGEPLVPTTDRSAVCALAATPDDRRAVSWNSGGMAQVWDLKTGNCLRVFEGPPDPGRLAAVTPDGRWAFCAADKMIHVWDLETGECQRVLEVAARLVTAMAAMPDCRRVVCGDFDGMLRIWDLETGECLGVLKGHQWALSDVAITPDGGRAVSAAHHAVRLWDLRTGECLHVLEGHKAHVALVAATPDGRRAVSGSKDRTLRVWDIETGECLLVLEGHLGGLTSLAVTPDGRRAVTGSEDRALRVWDLDTGECLHVLEGHANEVRCAAVTHDCRWAVSASRDRALRVWDLETGQATVRFNTAGCPDVLIVSPHAPRIVAGDDLGRVYALVPENFEARSPYVTAWRSGDDSRHAFGCPACRRWCEIPASVVGHEVACQYCGEVARLNPFAIHAEWQAVAKAWRPACP